MVGHSENTSRCLVSSDLSVSPYPSPSRPRWSVIEYCSDRQRRRASEVSHGPRQIRQFDHLRRNLGRSCWGACLLSQPLVAAPIPPRTPVPTTRIELAETRIYESSKRKDLT